MIKTLNKYGYRGYTCVDIYMCLNIIKAIYDKFITNIIFDDGKLKTFH